LFIISTTAIINHYTLAFTAVRQVLSCLYHRPIYIWWTSTINENTNIEATLMVDHNVIKSLPPRFILASEVTRTLDCAGSYKTVKPNVNYF